MKRIKKSVLNELKERLYSTYGFSVPNDWIFYSENRNRLWLTTPEVDTFDASGLKTETFGIYFCFMDEDRLRLSPEGAQLVGEKATKNAIDIDYNEALSIVKGFDIEKHANLSASYIILKSPIGIIGVGKNSNGKILCQIRKSRRIRNIN